MAKTKKTLINALSVAFFLTIVGIGSVFDSNAAGWKFIGIEIDYQREAVSYKKSCDSGSIRECYLLGTLYKEGLGVKKNYTKATNLYKKAANLFKKACDEGDSLRCNNLGDLYKKGLGVEQSYTKATFFYKKACDGNAPIGCYNLGHLYLKEVFIGLMYIEKKNYTKAANLFKEACNGGCMLGCVHLGNLYDKGLGVEQDWLKAVKLYEKACNNGCGAGCNELGVMFYEGGYKIKAYQYWMKAARLGSTEAQHNLDILCKESPWACK